jgi:chemotaxis protein histidine kinase CheA
MDHGIEGPDERKSKGKVAEGCISIAVEEHEQSLVIRYSDDGRGLALTKILEKARKQSLVAEDVQLSRAEIAELIFAAGFSTAEKTTDISGRGVGMDAVRSYIEEVGGSVKLEVLEGGTVDFAPIAFVITLPYKPMDVAEAS